MQTSAYNQSNAPTPGRSNTTLHEEVDRLSRRLQSEAVLAVELLEKAVEALRSCNREEALDVRRRDTEIDREEVRIEEECIRLIALQQPVARDLRTIMVIIKANADVERIADHASGIAKAVSYLGDEASPKWPTSLIELADRIIPLCHDTVRALGQRDEAGARQIIDGDKSIDRLSRQVVEEVERGIGSGDLSRRAGLLAFRASRDIERIGDLCANICEDILYARTGQIVRHAKRFAPQDKAE